LSFNICNDSEARSLSYKLTQEMIRQLELEIERLTRKSEEAD